MPLTSANKGASVYKLIWRTNRILAVTIDFICAEYWQIISVASHCQFLWPFFSCALRNPLYRELNARTVFQRQRVI